MLTGFFHEKVQIFFREKQESWYLATLSIWRGERNIGNTAKKKRKEN
jgi:hypothetical protein